MKIESSVSPSSVPDDDVARSVGEARSLAVGNLGPALERPRSLSGEPPSFLRDEALVDLAELARGYLRALLDGERHRASRMILEAVQAGVPVKRIYLDVFQPTQYEVGRLFQLNEVGVGEEHYCTAATQLIISQLYPQIFASEKGPNTLVATCVAGDLHELGARMVTDFFEMDGWNTYYFGAGSSSQAVVATVAQRRARVLAISAPYHVSAVGELIEKIRAHPACGRVKIMVGGYPFRVDPDLWSKLGADGSATDAQQAISLANRWVADESR